MFDNGYVFSPYLSCHNANYFSIFMLTIYIILRTNSNKIKKYSALNNYNSSVLISTIKEK